MKKITLLMGAFILFSAFRSDSVRRAEISNEMVKARLILPDTKNGYYMATRFDWSGIIESLEFKGHNYFGKWFDEYDPLIHDAIMGPVEEYAPLNYDETPTGGTFVKIGVGTLKKPQEESFDRFGLYQITDHGIWKIKKKADQIQFIHTLTHDVHSYIYTKTIRLDKDKPVLVISHKLKNTGKNPIRTNGYNHNFFVFDNQPVGPEFEVIFPYNPGWKGELRNIGTIADIQNNRIVFIRNLEKRETVFCGSVTGFKNIVTDFDIKVENKKTGAGVRITGNKPLLKLIFWASPTTLCPETYVDIDIEPGKEFSWDFYYTFYTFDVRK